MSRFLFLGHGFFLSLVLVLPLLRNAWDLWAQTLVLGAWAFWIGLGTLLLWRRGARFPALERALRAWGPLWAGIVGWSLVSMGISQHPHSAVPGALMDLSTGAFFFLGAGLSKEKRGLYFCALAGAGVLTGLVAVAQDGLGAAGTGLAVNPNALAAVALLALPFAVGLWGTTPAGPGRWGWGVVAGTIVVALLLSRSLVAIAVMGAQGVFLWVGAGRRRGRWAGVATIAVVSAGLFLDRGELGKFLGDPDRWSWWRTAMNMIKTHPWFGVGPGAFGEAYSLFHAENWGLNSLYAHNAMLEWIAERGILGGGLWLGWAGGVLWVSRTAWTTWEGRGPWAALAGVLVFNFVHIGFSFPAVLWLFALAAGLAVNTLSGRGMERPGVRRWGSLIVAAVYLAAAAALVRQWRAGQLLEQGRAALFRNDPSAARTWADRGLRWNPRSPELFALRAGARARAADPSGALADLSAAARLAPGAAGFLMDRAELALSLKNADAALADYVEVNRRLPLFYPAWERRGDLLAAANRPVEAGEAYRTALKGLSDPRTRGRGENKGRTRERLEEKIRGVEAHAAN